MKYVKSIQMRSFFWSVFSRSGLNTEIYAVNLGIQFEYGKIETRKNSVFGHFSHNGWQPEHYTKKIIS